MRPIDADVAINTIQKDRETSWKELENDDVEYKNGCDDGYAYSMQIVSELPTLDVIPRQKYEKDMENAFTHGYTDAESKYRKMIEDGKLVEVVRCEDCKWNNGENYCLNERTFFELCADDAYCSFGERRTDEQT